MNLVHDTRALEQDALYSNCISSPSISREGSFYIAYEKNLRAPRLLRASIHHMKLRQIKGLLLAKRPGHQCIMRINKVNIVRCIKLSTHIL